MLFTAKYHFLEMYDDLITTKHQKAIHLFVMTFSGRSGVKPERRYHHEMRDRAQIPTQGILTTGGWFPASAAGSNWIQLDPVCWLLGAAAAAVTTAAALAPASTIGSQHPG
jgi:hypothetical protein